MSSIGTLPPIHLRYRGSNPLTHPWCLRQALIDLLVYYAGFMATSGPHGIYLPGVGNCLPSDFRLLMSPGPSCVCSVFMISVCNDNDLVQALTRACVGGPWGHRPKARIQA